MANKINVPVLIERIDNLREIVENNHKETTKSLDGIIARQDHTNGRVRAIEAWKMMQKGGWTIFLSITIPLIGILFWKINSEIKNLSDSIDNKIRANVKAEMNSARKEIDEQITGAIERNNHRFFEFDE